MRGTRIRAILYAFAAALFYAVNVPCSKILLAETAPTFMAGFLYLGAGIGVGIMYLVHFSHEGRKERLSRDDLPYAAGMVLLDIAAPILLMLGISIGSSANASLLGNFEIVATTIIAFLIFKENVSPRLWAAIALITLSSIILSFSGTDSLAFSIGSLFVIGATVCWGLENNCTRKISGKSTYQIVTIKGLCSGTGSVLIAIVIKEHMPDLRAILLILALGYVSYGLSIFTYIRAQKTLGAAKTSAYYAIAPFIGVMLSFIILREEMTVTYLIALLIMIIGTAVIVCETMRYNHKHIHSHMITHTHDGSTHTHLIEHSHDHCHVINEGKHGHTHPMEELESALR